MALNAKQRQFVAEYLIDLNATQAAIRAGYSAKTVAQIGNRLLRNVQIRAEIVQGQNARAERTQITADRVLEELGRIGFSDMRRFASWGGRGVELRASETLADDEARCVAEVSQTISAEGGSIKFKLHDKPSALVTIGKHLGMFTESHEHRFPDMPKDQRVDRLAAIFNGARARASATNGNGNGKHA